MRDVFPGYYRPTPDAFERFWTDGTFVLDANVLLSLYRFSAPARSQLLDVLAAIQGRLWLPHQAAWEFERNRIGVIDEQRKHYDPVLDELRKGKGRILSRIRRNSVMDTAELSKELDTHFAAMIERVEALQRSHPDPLDADDVLGGDSVRDAIATLLDGRVGASLDQTPVARDAAKRYAARVPPGYADEKKPEPERYGDLVLWYELIEHAKASGRPLVFVTGEQKEDWWLTHAGKTIGPRPELIHELRDCAGVPFYMYGLEAFMAEASRRLAIETSAETLREAKDAGTLSWTDDGWIRLMEGPRWTAPDERSRARAACRVGPDEVVLSLDVEGPGSADIVVCGVVHQAGEGSQSLWSMSYGTHAVLRYPQDFEPRLPLAPGSYFVTWWYRPDGAADPVTLATDYFASS